MKSLFDIGKEFNNFCTNEETYEQRHLREKNVRKAFKDMKATKKICFLYDEIYSTIYYADEEDDFFIDGIEIIEDSSRAYDNKDIYQLEQLLEMIKLPKKIRRVPFIIKKINEALGLSKEDMLHTYEYLSLIKTNDEVLIVYDAISKNIYTLRSYPRGYNEARKRKTRTNKIVKTYEHQIRFERHSLERLLQKNGVGINRSKKISQILKYII